MKNKRYLIGFVWSLLCIMFCAGEVYAADCVQITAKCKEAQRATLEITNVSDTELDGFDIYRADNLQGEYQLIGSVSTSDLWGTGYSNYDYNTDTYTDVDYVYTDPTVLNLYQTYYYRIQVYTDSYDIYGNTVKNYIQTVDVNVFVVGNGPTVTSAVRKGKNSASLTWTPVAGADGYMVYCLTDMDTEGNMIYVNTYDETQYQLVGTYSAGQTSTVYKKLTYGVTYTYRIYAYNNVNGEKVRSLSSEAVSVPMDYYAYAGEGYMQKVKRAFGSEKKQRKNYKTEKKARKQMKTISIKVWDFQKGKKGKKVTRIKYLTVNKRLAPTIKQIFKEIYESDEKQVIHDIGAYSYRTGQHMYGLAIDVNPTENYMIDGKKVMAGSYWKPNKDPYSIPNNSEFVKIMNRYGFYRGEWGARKDYMHFSYFGT